MRCRTLEACQSRQPKGSKELNGALRPRAVLALAAAGAALCENPVEKVAVCG
jgi:hypothetical protein